ncbi:MAG: 4Fe-4S binding protein, partial [Anaerovoracaceae bacterium]
FSATGNTEKDAGLISGTVSEKLGIEPSSSGFTLPEERSGERSFTDEDLVIIGMPTYAGKLPNRILPDLKTKLHGNGALAAAFVTFGSRNYDNSLAELVKTLTDDGFRVISAAALSSRHAFTDKVGTGRPDDRDEMEIRGFAEKTASMVLENGDFAGKEIKVPGDADAPYYTPRKQDGSPAKFLKAFPKVDMGKCTRCGICAEVCPEGSIDPDDVTKMTGICIKCQACVRKCPEGARYFDNEDFLSHVKMLEENFTARKENEFYYII